MVENLNDRSGGTIRNTHLVGSQALSDIIQNQNLQDTWKKQNPHKSEYTYHRPQSNIHSRLDRIHATKNMNILEAKIIPFQHSDHEALITEFTLRVGLRGPGYWKLNASILTQETFQTALTKLWQIWQQQKHSYDTLSQWWEIGKMYIKILAIHYCIETQKNIKTKLEELTFILNTEK